MNIMKKNYNKIVYVVYKLLVYVVCVYIYVLYIVYILYIVYFCVITAHKILFSYISTSNLFQNETRN